MDTLTLNALSIGQSACVAEVRAEPAMRRRLLDIGLIPGTRVTCVARSPAGDPCAYLIRGAVIALRGRDAGGIRMEAVPQSAPCGAPRACRPAPEREARLWG